MWGWQSHTHHSNVELEATWSCTWTHGCRGNAASANGSSAVKSWRRPKIVLLRQSEELLTTQRNCQVLGEADSLSAGQGPLHTP